MRGKPKASTVGSNSAGGGLEVQELTYERITKKPKRADTPIDIKTPIGALHEALRVSSDRWADASKPVQIQLVCTDTGQFRRTSDGVLTHKHTNRRHIGR